MAEGHKTQKQVSAGSKLNRKGFKSGQSHTLPTFYLWVTLPTFINKEGFIDILNIFECFMYLWKMGPVSFCFLNQEHWPKKVFALQETWPLSSVSESHKRSLETSLQKACLYTAHDLSWIHQLPPFHLLPSTLSLPPSNKTEKLLFELYNGALINSSMRFKIGVGEQ